MQTGPFGSQLHAADYVPVGIPSIMPQNIGDNRISPVGIARITLDDAERLSKYRVKPGDIVYSRRGDVERRALIRQAEDGWLCGTGCLRVRLGEGPVDPVFAAFFLGTPEAREWIVRHAHGATMPNLNTSILSACPIVVPPITEQRSIAATLGALDDKIELNRKMNATLEAMARALFRDWFVDFGPTRAKMEGRPAHLCEDLWSLFPDRLDDEGKPEGWEVSNLAAILSVLETGRRPKGGVAGISSGVPSVGAESIDGVGKFDFAKTKYVSEEFFAKMAKGHVSEGDVLIYKDGGKPGELRPSVSYASKGFPFRRFCINEHVFRARSDRVEQAFLYCLLSTDEAFAQMRELATGVAQPGLNQAQMGRLSFVLPEDQQLLDHAASILKTLIDACNVNANESRTLAETRDYLLPKLMSGEIRVRDAEKLAGEAA